LSKEILVRSRYIYNWVVTNKHHFDENEHAGGNERMRLPFRIGLRFAFWLLISELFFRSLLRRSLMEKLPQNWRNWIS